MEYHKALIRQIKRLKINSAELAPNNKQWQEFLEVVNKSYIEADEGRYLQERAMKISSQEVLDLNKNLETAQHIAKLGYWELDLTNHKIYWSKELYLLHGMTPGTSPPDYEQRLQMIHEEDRAHMKNLLDKAAAEDKSFDTYENELRISNAAGEYQWFYINFRRYLTSDSDSLKGIVMDITARKEAEQAINELNKQIIESSRLAGRADIASSTLHNVGNILNSVNVSVNLLEENKNKSSCKKLFSLIKILNENKSRFQDYIINDPQGKMFPEYLIALIEKLKKEDEFTVQEIANVKKYVNNVIDIVTAQNDISRAPGVKEKIFLPQVIDEAIEMVGTTFDQHNITVSKQYEKIPFIYLDKIKLSQILVNLISNAQDAVLGNINDKSRTITISLREDKPGNAVYIVIKDNGVGIIKENISKVFSLGFTTKQNGHGFGLHMSAIAASELGGSLIAESEGLEKGAFFTLKIPRDELPQQKDGEQHE